MEIREDFSALLDGELTLEEREVIEGHLSECAGCLRELDALKQVDVAYSALSRMKAPEGFEEGVREAIRPRTLRFPALGKGRSTRWMRPVAAIAALLLVMFGAMFVLQPTEPDRVQIANVLKDETPALEAERGVFSPAPSEPAEVPAFAVSQEERAPGPSSAPAVDEKRDAQLADADDVLETIVRVRPDAPEEAEIDAARFRSQSKASANEVKLEQGRIETLGYLGRVGADGRLADKRPAAEKAVQSFGGVRAPAQELLSHSLEGVALYERQSESMGVDAGQVVTAREALRQRDEVLGQPLDPEAGIAGVEPGKAAKAQRGRVLVLVGGRADEGERVAVDRFEDRVERALNEATSIKTIRVRSYKVAGDGVWVEQGYNGEVTQLLKRGSPELEALVVLDPELKTLLKGTARAIFQVEGKWYTLEEAKEGN